ncbi:MAG: type II secretion system F family protein [Planctomycetes bacterium]|nr:type II secretion system F family protein [Planctomycetota bacterium]
MKVAYKAYDETGTEVSDSVEAASLAEATERLRQRGLYVTSMNEDAGPPEAAPAAAPARRQQRGGRLKNVAIFARQLAVLIRTGTPLAQALQAVTRQAPPGPWRTVLTDLHRQIEEGNTLSHSMELHPTYFDPVCTSLIAAGESSGQLEKMLDRLSNLTRQQLKIRRSVTAALIYPILLGVVGITVVTVMIGFVLPRFKDLFLSLDAPLPPTTEILMAFSDFLRSKWWIVLIVSAIAGVGLKLAASTAAGRRALEAAAVGPHDIDFLLHTSVSRDCLEPATASTAIASCCVRRAPSGSTRLVPFSRNSASRSSCVTPRRTTATSPKRRLWPSSSAAPWRSSRRASR